MDAAAFWKKIGGKDVPAENDIVAFLGLPDKDIVAGLLKAVFVPADVAKSAQVMHGLEWGLPREFQRVRQAIDNPVKEVSEASEGFEDMVLDEAEADFAHRALQELTIFKGMIGQRLKMISSGAVDEVRAVLAREPS
jgi:hypothetical protein